MKLDLRKLLGALPFAGLGIMVLLVMVQRPPSRHEKGGHWQYDIVDFDKKLVACKDCKVVLLRDGPDHQDEWDQWEKLRNSQ